MMEVPTQTTEGARGTETETEAEAEAEAGPTLEVYYGFTPAFLAWGRKTQGRGFEAWVARMQETAASSWLFSHCFAWGSSFPALPPTGGWPRCASASMLRWPSAACSAGGSASASGSPSASGNRPWTMRVKVGTSSVRI